MRKQSPEKITAIHEAGHAVAAHFLHVKVRHVTIIPKTDSLGHVLHHQVSFGLHGEFDDSLRGTDRAERHIIVCFAGQLAERKAAPRSHWRAGSSADYEQAMELFWRIAHSDERARNLQLALMWRKTECLVDARWKQIEAVAAALLERKTLKASELRLVIDESFGRKPFRAERRP